MVYLFIHVYRDHLWEPVIANICRPPRNNTNLQIQTFCVEIGSIITDLSKANTVFVGDLNITFLKNNDLENIQDYVDLFMGLGHKPQINIPTRHALKLSSIFKFVNTSIH